ncbi:Uncharacterized beta-barrel protein YwiB, DUF1934 family [Oceanobacillus limi]|uniref:Uncharacterized beta-barrel protein YwiB, DUF1934 family n=1 Tax=Oceanobacillus limi TaxID=930131 RepID=A0A1I0GXY8_9BACI|nr:DUF1934 domain-containing protein [Oceanobacillus limi]SET75406.1 Uncharacterized beta-barrel protein YwiB, DUF1934 family [Oceanobacillus limi]
MSRKVMVELETTIEDNGQKERSNTMQQGVFHHKQNMDVLTFEEQTEDGQQINNMITIQQGKVSIKRSGVVSMHQQFRLNQTTENVFRHPHGNIHMETYTDEVYYRPINDEQSGRLTIDYTVKLNGQTERKHALQLTYKDQEEDSQ